MNDWTEITMNDLNKSQRRGAMKIIRDCNDRAQRLQKYGVALSVQLQRYGKLVSIIAKVKLHGLGEGNLLRYTQESEYFHAFIGTRGKVKAVTYPKSLEQFKGRSNYTGIHFA